jgi:hypothetical protein
VQRGSRRNADERRVKSAGVLDRTIAAAAAGFIAILAIAAYWDRSIVWLHTFQSLMYFATIFLVLRHKRAGYFLGFSIAAFWNYCQFFVTGFLRSGLEQGSMLLHTGALPRPDQFISVPAVILHFAMIVCCVAAYLGLKRKSATDLVWLIVIFAASTAYFAGDMALTQPRYLTMFPRALHPSLKV